jgi:hypothetical protein
MTETSNMYIIQVPAEIPDKFAKQLWVEPLAWGICHWALFYRDSKHFSCHGALACKASGFCCGDVYQKQRLCLNSEDISSALQYSSERVSSENISKARCKKRNQGQRWIWTEHQGISGSNFSQHAATRDAQLPETLGIMCWQQETPPHRHYIKEVNVAIKILWVKDYLVINLRIKIVYFSFYFNLKIVRFFCRTLYLAIHSLRSFHSFNKPVQVQTALVLYKESCNRNV